jgi:Ni/Fe-hydrogenase subunit HybB-like protein
MENGFSWYLYCAMLPLVFGIYKDGRVLAVRGLTVREYGLCPLISFS